MALRAEDLEALTVNGILRKEEISLYSPCISLNDGLNRSFSAAVFDGISQSHGLKEVLSYWN